MKPHRLSARPSPAFALVLAGLSILPAAAQVAATPDPWSLELASSRQQLSNNSPDWTENTARLSHRWDTRHTSELGLAQTQRFGLDDDQLSGLLVRPLDERLTATVDASLSPTHRVLAKHHLGAMLQYEFAPAWLVHGGLRSTQYNSTTVTQGAAMLEHYVGSFSWLVAWRPVQTQGSNTSNTELRGSYYYADRSRVSLSISSGQEAAQISDSDLLLANVRSTVLSGRHWLAPAWALNYEWSSTRQGEFYTRSGWRIGVQHLF